MRTTSRPHRFRLDRVAVRNRLRSPLAHWIVAFALAAAAVVGHQRRETALDRREAALGPTVEVVVLTASHAAGDAVGADDVELRRVPRSLVPDGALTRAPEGQRLRVPVHRGEVLVAARLGDAATSALAAAVPDGRRALSVPLADGALPLSPGDEVDLLSLTAEGTSAVITAAAPVLVADERSATVAVPREVAPMVADAVLAGAVTLSLVGPR